MPVQSEGTRTSYVPRSQEAHIRFLESLHQSAHTYKDRWTRSWPKSAEVYRGDNWDSKKEGNPFFKTNLARAKLDRKAAKLTASKPIFGVLPHRSGMTNAARILQRTITALWDTLDMQMRIEQLSGFVRPFGCGFFKTVWDPRARNGLGDLVVAEIDPRCIDIDPYTLRSYDLDRSLVVIHETSMPFSWLKTNFPRHANEVDDMSAPPPSVADRGMGDGNRSSSSGELHTAWGRYLSGLRGSSQPSKGSPIPYVRVREFWYADPQEEDDKPLYPNGRVTYLVGTGRKAVIVNPEKEASKNPFFDGMWPFDMYDARADIDHPWGSSQVEDIRRIEEAVNRSGHMALRNLMKNVTRIVADSGALAPDYLKKLSDFGDIVINKMRGLDVNIVQSQNAVQESINLIQLALSLMDMQIGLGGDSPISGRGRVELRSPDLLYGLQQATDDIINLEARRLESFLERVGSKMISRIFQFYSSDRLIPYIGAKGIESYLFEVKNLRQEIYSMAVDAVSSKLIDSEQGEESDRKKAKVVNFETVKMATQEALKGAHKEFDFKIVPLSSLATTRAARAKTMAEFQQQGALPMSMVMMEAGFENWEDLQEEAIQEKLRIGQMYQAAGLEPPAPPGSQQKKSSSKK